MENWSSHGGSSNLIEHSKEVAQAGTTDWEYITILCHDIGKACKQWQAYARRGFKKEYPHPKHAFFGAVIAYYLLEDKIEKLTAFHTIMAHHSQLGSQQYEDEAFSIILHDEETNLFTKSALQKYISEEKIESTWAELKTLYKKGRTNAICKVIKSDIKNLTEEEKIICAEKSKDLLGRLVYADHQSAKKQQENLSIFLPTPQIKYGKTIRKKPIYTEKSKISKLREELKNKCLNLPTNERIYIINAPTGAAKTNAILCLAENILKEENIYTHITYAVPQTSIGDQIAADYLDGQYDEHGNPIGQIWNYKRKEKLTGVKEEDNQKLYLDAKDIYASKYNVTTFNQIAYALIHPHREYCVRSNSLKNCIIILDEYHKMPIATLALLFRLTNPKISKRNIVWILSSATPFHAGPTIFGNQKIKTLPTEFTDFLETHPTLTNRRTYSKGKKKNAEDIVEIIKEAALNKKSLLCMINLIEKGTAHIAELLNIPAAPWEREIMLHGTPVFWLDSTVPQAYRKTLLEKIKKKDPRKNPCVLLCTPIIQAGVDLDFQEGIADWESLASAIQTGGRVGRNGDKQRNLEIFEFITETQKTTKEIIRNFQKKGLQGAKGSRLEALLTSIETEIETKENKFFDKWEHPKTERELQTTLNKITEFAIKDKDLKLGETLNPASSDDTIGLKIEDWHELSTLYADNERSTSIIIETIPENIDQNWINDKIKTHGANLNCRMEILLKNSRLEKVIFLETEIWRLQIENHI
jgi:CRISPR-associated endonuclease/helicase Cas3